MSHIFQFPSLMLHKGFFIRNGTRKRKAPKTMEYVEPKIPTSGCAVIIAKYIKAGLFTWQQGFGILHVVSGHL
jgi:hypothetical protein